MGSRIAGKVDAQLDGRWILVVDDEPAIRFTVEKVLRAHGAVCHGAASHAEALRTVEDEARFEVAILDYAMPDGDGAELAPRLRAVRPELFVVGNSGTDRRHEFRRAGVDRFLPKPWRVEELIEVLRESTRTREVPVVELASHRRTDRGLDDTMDEFPPLRLALSVVDISSIPDTDAALRFVLSLHFASLSAIAEYGLHTYREREDHDPPTTLVRHAAADLLRDLEAIQRAACSPLPRRLEPAACGRDRFDAVVNTRAVLADLALRRLEGEATTYLLGVFDRVPAPDPAAYARR
jgi:CheY-like chemotaxis protein